MNKKLFTLAAVATMLAACSSNDEIVTQEENLKDTPITIASAGVAEPATRVINDDGTLTGSMASLGLYANMDATDDKYKANHECYFYSSSWSFSNFYASDDRTQMLYSGENFGYIAYSPYYIMTVDSEDNSTDICLREMTEFSVPTDGDYDGAWSIGTDETYVNPTSVSGSQYDLLWGTGTATSATLNLSLDHVLTMLVVNITGLGTTIKNNPTVDGVTIGGTVVTGTLNLTDATTSSDVVTVKSDESATDITAMDVTAAEDVLATYEALIIPQTVALQITVALSNDKTYATTLSNRELKSGYKYTINLKVGQDKVAVSSVSVNGWTTDATTTITAPDAGEVTE